MLAELDAVVVVRVVDVLVAGVAVGAHQVGVVVGLEQRVLLDDPADNISVKRILVMDGGANGVGTLRAFNGSDEYYITILDDNQTKERKFKHIREEIRYKYGNATLVDCKIELLDSKEPGYIYECRAVIVKWDNGRKSVLITDIPHDLLNASEIAKKYFDRWPMQEKQFRDAKSGVNIHRIAGYGKKIENYDKMSEKHGELCERITQLKDELEKPLSEIEAIEEQLTDIYWQERTFREKSKIVDGKRVLSEVDSVESAILIMAPTHSNCRDRSLKFLRFDSHHQSQSYLRSDQMQSKSTDFSE